MSMCPPHSSPWEPGMSLRVPLPWLPGTWGESGCPHTPNLRTIGVSLGFPHCGYWEHGVSIRVRLPGSGECGVSLSDPSPTPGNLG